jgi:fimbrial chaperone protein
MLAWPLVFVGSSPASALRLVPFIAEFAPSGPAATQLFRVENDGDEPVAVQISMVHRQMGIDGKEAMPDADDDFAVFPPQIVLTGREARTVRIQYIGDPKPAREVPYRVIAEQLPVDLDNNPGGARLRLLVRYEGAVYVVPPDVSPRAEVKSIESVRLTDGSPGLAITVENSGTAHALLSDLKLVVKSADGTSMMLDQPEQLDGIFGENVLAGVTRRFVIGWPKGLKPSVQSASMTFGVQKKQ